GRNNSRNSSYRVEDAHGVGKASILAVLCAARECSRDKNLIIYMSSEYVIRSLCFWAGENKTCGWACTNGDELRDTVEWIAQRRAQMEFRWVSSKSGN
ncbi:hypothetical protein C8R44DRAFT_542271, partial [Mycena epipterygia]